MISSRAGLGQQEGSSHLNLMPQLIENYLPELSEADIIGNRHRECHKLPESLRSQQTNLRLNIELSSLEVKLYEGWDFDFVVKN